MNSSQIYQLIKEIFANKKINYKLLNKLKRKSVSDLKSTVKIYLLQFLFDKEDKTAHILNKNDLWFIKENADNIDIINKYIVLLSNILKKDNLFNIDIIKEFELFINTDIGTKLVYIISILNQFNLSNIIYLLFLGFVIGEKKEFIKRNYITNLKDILKNINLDISSDSNRLYVYSLSERVLEILNLYICLNKYLAREKNYINKLRNVLLNADSQNCNLFVYYNKLAKEELLDFLFFKKEGDTSSIIYKKKVLELKKIIDSKIEDYKKMNQELFNDNLSNSEENINEINNISEQENEDEDDDDDEEEEEEEIVEEEIKEKIIISTDGKMQNSLLNEDINSKLMSH